MTQEKEFKLFFDPEDRYFFEKEDTFYGNIFYELRQKMLRSTTIEQLKAIEKEIQELEYPFFNINVKFECHNSITKYFQPMTFMEIMGFKMELSNISFIAIEKKAKIINLLEIYDNKITLKNAFEELSQEDKDLYNALTSVQNKIILLKGK